MKNADDIILMFGFEKIDRNYKFPLCKIPNPTYSGDIFDQYTHLYVLDTSYYRLVVEVYNDINIKMWVYKLKSLYKVSYFEGEFGTFDLKTLLEAFFLNKKYNKSIKHEK